MTPRFSWALGLLLVQARQRVQRTQAQVAEASGVGQSSLSRYEAGTVDISVTALIRLTEALDTRAEDVLSSALKLEARVTALCPGWADESPEKARAALQYALVSPA
jgi:transcriptional regulator with XRE-family HTH domain